MDKTIDMAREAGWTSYDSQDERFKAFEALVRADERDLCAQVVWEMKGKCWAYDHDTIAAAIRNRGNT
jgi:hypothetical protein